MPPSRARSARPSASQRPSLRPEADGMLARQMRNPPPAYKAPRHPLSEISRRKLAGVAKAFERRKNAERNAAAVRLLADCAHDLGETLKDFESRLQSEKNKAEKEGADSTRLEQWQEKFDSFKPKHDNLEKRLEKYARTCVDLTKRDEIARAATERCMEAAPLGHTQRARGGRRTNTQGDGSSFEPTLPGATGNGDEEDGEGDTTMAEPVESTLEKFKTRREQTMQAWTAKTLHDRYGNNAEYTNFRESRHEGYYGDEEEIPPSTRWFQTEEPAPGTATQGAADESDDDIQVARQRVSTKCPLTLQEFKNPVMSSVCKHTFEQSAIHEMIGRKPQVQCPVPGCSNFLTRAQLEPNEKLLRKIRRIQQSRTRHREELDEDDDRPRGTHADTSILLSDEPEAGGFQSVEDAMKHVKREKFSQMSRQRAGGGGDDDDDEEVTDEDTEDE